MSRTLFGGRRVRPLDRVGRECSAGSIRICTPQTCRESSVAAPRTWKATRGITAALLPPETPTGMPSNNRYASPTCSAASELKKYLSIGSGSLIPLTHPTRDLLPRRDTTLATLVSSNNTSTRIRVATSLKRTNSSSRTRQPLSLTGMLLALSRRGRMVPARRAVAPRRR